MIEQGRNDATHMYGLSSLYLNIFDVITQLQLVAIETITFIHAY